MTKLEILLEAARRATWDALTGPKHLRAGRYRTKGEAVNEDDDDLRSAIAASVDLGAEESRLGALRAITRLAAVYRTIAKPVIATELERIVDLMLAAETDETGERERAIRERIAAFIHGPPSAPKEKP